MERILTTSLAQELVSSGLNERWAITEFPIFIFSFSFFFKIKLYWDDKYLLFLISLLPWFWVISGNLCLDQLDLLLKSRTAEE